MMTTESANGCPIVTSERVTASISGKTCTGTVSAWRPVDLPDEMVMVKWDSLPGWPEGLTVREFISELSAIHCHCQSDGARRERSA